MLMALHAPDQVNGLHYLSVSAGFGQGDLTFWTGAGDLQLVVADATLQPSRLRNNKIAGL